MIIPMNKYNANQAKDQNILGNLIKETRVKKGYTQKTFAESLSAYGLEIRPAAVSKWENGDILPNPYQLLAICIALGIKDLVPQFTGQHVSLYPELNAAGEKKVQEYVDTLIKSKKYVPLQRKQVKFIELPLYDLPVSAGTGVYLDESTSETVRFAITTVPEGTDYCLKISGDSMTPNYQDNQIVFVQATEVLDPGDIGIFFYDGNGYIKMLDTQEPAPDRQEEFADSAGFIHEQTILVSLNEKYAPIEINPNNEFKILGRVLN